MLSQRCITITTSTSQPPTHSTRCTQSRCVYHLLCTFLHTHLRVRTHILTFTLAQLCKPATTTTTTTKAYRTRRSSSRCSRLLLQQVHTQHMRTCAAPSILSRPGGPGQTDLSIAEIVKSGNFPAHNTATPYARRTTTAQPSRYNALVTPDTVCVLTRRVQFAQHILTETFALTPPTRPHLPTCHIPVRILNFCTHKKSYMTIYYTI